MAGSLMLMGEFREKEWRWESSGKRIRQKQFQTTVFVSSLPPRLHWQGLWFAFARHGEVIDAFIPEKKSKKGIRYGFVRFVNLEDAEKGHVEDETLRKLRKCLIGTMETVCSTSQVKDHLQAWGLNDITVKYMGGCRFLIDIKDQDLSTRLQIQQWAILKEIFTEVETWTDLFHLPERTTWIQVTSVPLHCWNLTTFKRIVDSWGSLISLGENASQSFDCEKVTLLISTQQRERINEVSKLKLAENAFWFKSMSLD
ncbi:hypothetical protein V6N13_038135 [Hibiscus sabdariffa]